MYTPDRWIILEINNDGIRHQRVFAGWCGGYGTGDSWRMNSGITEVIDLGDSFEFKGESGSSYICHKGNYGMSAYMNSILDSYLVQCNEKIKITIVEGYGD